MTENSMQPRSKVYCLAKYSALRLVIWVGGIVVLAGWVSVMFDQSFTTALLQLSIVLVVEPAYLLRELFRLDKTRRGRMSPEGADRDRSEHRKTTAAKVRNRVGQIEFSLPPGNEQEGNDDEPELPTRMRGLEPDGDSAESTDDHDDWPTPRVDRLEVVSDQEILDGIPHFRGNKMFVHRVAERADDVGIERCKNELEITEEHVKRAREYAKNHPRKMQMAKDREKIRSLSADQMAEAHVGEQV